MVLNNKSNQNLMFIITLVLYGSGVTNWRRSLVQRESAQYQSARFHGNKLID